MLQLQYGIMCKKCFKIIYGTPEMPAQQCPCGNCAVILDVDQHINLYVDDIKTTQRAVFLHTGNFVEVQRQLLRPFAQEIYVAYHDIRNTPITYRPPREKNKYKRKTTTKYNQRLIDAFDRHNHITSDGKEDFRCST